jgi:hypothetical protein
MSASDQRRRLKIGWPDTIYWNSNPFFALLYRCFSGEEEVKRRGDQKGGEHLFDIAIGGRIDPAGRGAQRTPSGRHRMNVPPPDELLWRTS